MGAIGDVLDEKYARGIGEYVGGLGRGMTVGEEVAVVEVVGEGGAIGELV